MEQSGMHVLKLNIGNPAPFGFRTPDEVVYDMSRQSATRKLLRVQGPVLGAQGDHAVRAAQEPANVGIEDIYTGNGAAS
mgnify:CR=1 FL=1